MFYLIEGRFSLNLLLLCVIENIPNEIWKALVIASDYLCGVARMICAIIEAIDGDRDMQLVDYIKELERDSSMVWIFQTINALVSLPQVEINLSKVLLYLF